MNERTDERTSGRTEEAASACGRPFRQLWAVGGRGVHSRSPRADSGLAEPGAGPGPAASHRAQEDGVAQGPGAPHARQDGQVRPKCVRLNKAREAAAVATRPPELHLQAGSGSQRQMSSRHVAVTPLCSPRLRAPSRRGSECVGTRAAHRPPRRHGLPGTQVPRTRACSGTGSVSSWTRL